MSLTSIDIRLPVPGTALTAVEQLFGYKPEPIVLRNPALLAGHIPLLLPAPSNVPDLPSKGCLKVVAYVHNRITLCSYQGGSKRVAKRMKARGIAKLVKGGANFNLCRKSRHQLKVGGRWRSLPLETSFTSRARNWIRDAGYLIETEAGGVPLFLTLTCPGGTEEVFKAFGIASGYVVDRFNRWLRYRVDKGWFEYVWEVQKRGAPHLHYLFRIQAGANFSVFYKEARQQWRKILLDVSKECGVDLFSQSGGGTHAHHPNLPVINFRKVKTSVSGYLSKYASKAKSKGVRGISFQPGRWWGISYSIRRECLLRRVTYVLGFTEIEKATQALVEVCEKIGSIVKTAWRAESERPTPGEFISLVIRMGTAPDIANALRAWFINGDLSELIPLLEVPCAVPVNST